MFHLLFHKMLCEMNNVNIRIIVKFGEMISLNDENGTKISSFSVVPSEFVEDMESSWKGRVKGMHIEKEFVEVERAAEALSLAVSLQKS
ncbi:hypothetical protein FNV43_RR02366 [Rhamnella rubrinervis]|uniref:Uncharacterized protein n=1 Tax=Rhamnella rubrinervis TaxID=2594499 RepID=A0A8K0HTJ3_9ROSA|nr:hypothetical protein FNV43_RR02366 [Rhamnella rubrinervis]